MIITNINTFIFPKIGPQDRYLYSQVARCIFGYHKLLLSYSGGLDSTVLLDILVTLINNSNSLMKSVPPFFLRAVYVHHGLSNQADYWGDHCAQQCKIRNIPFQIIYINCDNFYNIHHNLEASARYLRYQQLCNYLSIDEILLTAHHMDDQVETVLLALKRGSGPTGLSGIHKNMMLYKHRLLRPLLECSRSQLKKYADRKKLIWIEDDTNMNIRFDRNFLRIKIIPLLKKRWSFLNTVITRTAQLCRNQNDLLHELLLESLNELIDLDGALFFYPLFKYSMLRRQALLRYWLSNFFTNMPSYKLLDCIWKEVVLSKIDAQPILFLGEFICRRFRKKLYILPIDMASSVNRFSLSWDLSNNVILLPGKLGLLVSKILTIDKSFFQKKIELHINLNLLSDIFSNYFNNSGKLLTSCLVRAPKNNEKVTVRFGHAHGLLYIWNRNHGRKLKKIWQELNIPPWLRSRIPLLFYDDILISAIGVFITKDGEATIISNPTNNNYSIWRIFWLQNAVYYDIFKHTIHHVLK